MPGNLFAGWRERETVLAAFFLVILTTLALRPEIRGLTAAATTPTSCPCCRKAISIFTTITSS